MFQKSLTGSFSGLLGIVFALSASCRAFGDESVRYSTQIAPILRTYCVSCHSRADAENGLSLQAPDDILKGSENGPVLDAAMPSDSRLLKVLSSTGDDHMPPADHAQPSAEEMELLRKWLADGAAFDSRMAVLPALPKIAVTASKVRSPALTMAMTDDNSLLIGRFRSVEKQSKRTDSVDWSFPIPDGKVNGLRLSPDGKRVIIATGTPGLSGRAIEVAIGGSSILREYAGHNDILYAADWSPNGNVVATAGYDRRIIIHNTETGEKIRELTGHNGAIFDLRFSPDGTLLATASADATIKVWSVATGERFDTLSQPQSEQYAVAFSPDGQFIFGAGADSRIRKWQVVSKTTPQINPILISRFAHEGTITRMAISADGRFLVTSSEAGSIKMWDAANVVELSAESLKQDLVSSLVFDHADSQVVIATSRGERKFLPFPTPLRQTSKAAVDLPNTTLETSLAFQEIADAEPNDAASAPQIVSLPARISGLINSTDTGVSDADAFRFEAKNGQSVLIEVNASRSKSPLDSTIEVLDAEGKPILQAQLQAVRDSYFTFRGKDSDTPDDFRLFNWQEMELNEYLYADGEVVKLWLYPRGPDSGFKVYPGFEKRQTYFATTPTSHPLQGPAFIVNAHRPDEVLKDTGLPVFPIYFENDDDSMRQWGSDSRLLFIPPADGPYVCRIRDARGFQGADFKYEMLIRSPRPDFSTTMSNGELTVHRGTGSEIGFTATRLDGYDGPIEIFAENLPTGLSLSSPVLIQDEQRQAFAVVIAASDANQPSEEDIKKIVFKARAQVGEKEIVHDIGGLKSLKVVEKPKAVVKVLSPEHYNASATEQTPEITVWAGETTRAYLKVDRIDHKGIVTFGNEDSGRNMPHGVFVDNIGLNGLMLLEGQNEREFFITVAKWVPETSRPFHLRSNVEGGITSLPVMLHVRRRSEDEPRTAAAE